VWSRAYDEPLRARLGAPKQSKLKIHSVLGSDKDGRLPVFRFAAAQARGFDPSIPWRSQTVSNWFDPDGNAGAVVTELLATGALPPTKKEASTP